MGVAFESTEPALRERRMGHPTNLGPVHARSSGDPPRDSGIWTQLRVEACQAKCQRKLRRHEARAQTGRCSQEVDARGNLPTLKQSFSPILGTFSPLKPSVQIKRAIRYSPHFSKTG